MDDAALLRRLILKHCVFGVDVSPMGAEIALMSLWLASFVPGLSLSYLNRNVIVGDSLIGVASAETIGKVGTIWYDNLVQALNSAIEAVAQLADIEDRTPDEVEASKSADTEAWAATEGIQRLFDLWTAEGLGLAGARSYVETHALNVISARHIDKQGYGLMGAAQDLCQQYRPLHWPLVFPRVFDRERKRPGFDVVIGNPPWKEVTVEELSFYGRYIPGLLGLTDVARSRMVHNMIRQRPDLVRLLNKERERALIQRSALLAGEYEGMKGDPDLYKYFCQRYRYLTRDGGFIGVVLPRGAFVTDGARGFREWLYRYNSTRRVDFLKNTRSWAFPDVSSQQSIALVVAERATPSRDHCIEIAGRATSREEWEVQSSNEGIRLSVSTFGQGWMTPIVSSQVEADVLAKVRVGDILPFGQRERERERERERDLEQTSSQPKTFTKPRIATSGPVFVVKELDETLDRRLWIPTEVSVNSRPLWKGESFDQYKPHGAHHRFCPETEDIWNKFRNKRPGQNSSVGKILTLADRRKAVFIELNRARVAFRLISRGTDPRTIIACLVPPRVFLVNSAPYLAFVNGDELTQALYLGVMNSLPFDWQARRFVDRNVNFFILESLILPRFDYEDFYTIARCAARLSTVDDRFADFASATGVELGPIDPDHQQRLRVEIDARVARAWNLTRDDIYVILDDFTTFAVPKNYRVALVNRLVDLT